MEKYELTSETISHQGRVLRRIRALAAFGSVKAGELGGWIEGEENLAQQGGAWVSETARVYGGARVSGDAQVYGDARIYDDARVSGGARAYGHARIYGAASLSGNAEVYDDARVCGGAKVFGRAKVFDQARISGQTRIYGRANVFEQADISGQAEVFGDVSVLDGAVVSGSALVSGCAYLASNAEVFRPDHMLAVGPVGYRGPYVTFYRTRDRRIEIFMSGEVVSLREFLPHGGDTAPDRDGLIYHAAYEMARLQIDLSE